MEKTTETPYKRYNLKVCSEVFENSRRKKNEWKKVAVGGFHFSTFRIRNNFFITLYLTVEGKRKIKQNYITSYIWMIIIF